MANITVTYAEIESAAARLSAGRNEITDRLQQLQAQIGELVSSGFVTEQASGKFNDAYSRYTSDANRTIAHLDEIQSFLHQTAQAVRDLDTHIAARIT